MFIIAEHGVCNGKEVDAKHGEKQQKSPQGCNGKCYHSLTDVSLALSAHLT